MNQRTLAGRAGVTLGVVVLVLLTDWLLTSEASPLYEYLLWHVAVSNIWTAINLGPLFLGVAMSGNVHQPSIGGYLLGLVLQWGIVGLMASLLIVRSGRAKHR